MKPIEQTTHSDEYWPQSLIDLLERQQALAGRLRDLAGHQGALIESGRTEPLLGLLAQRQRLIDEFTAMQGELGAKTVNLEERLSGVGDAQKQRIRSLIDDIGGALSEIMEQDQEDQKALEAARENVRQELSTTGTVRMARTAYTKTSGVRTRFADRQG